MYCLKGISIYVIEETNRVYICFSRFFTIIITTLFFQDYEYVKYVKGAGLMCWFVSAFLIPNYEPRKVSKNR